MAGTPRGPNDTRPTRGDFPPRNRGQVEDALDEGARAVSRWLADGGAEDVDPTRDTDWEARVGRGEEWTNEQVPEREARGDEEPDSEVSRRGLANPPPEE
ncbi:hypothetical protein LXT21_24885 [Myxococcus sp. K38C18041901]|uniref:hypothetical protein n=1 Tax=Myxococcus guangdongensis TaxID=2906760 RepID=UPI0020A81A05|nr:hypothetical protein [Myxococcus guangdongensis]MCP3062025.1 hypothetical protein [Myxococcus guangdongensis]